MPQGCLAVTKTDGTERPIYFNNRSDMLYGSLGTAASEDEMQIICIRTPLLPGSPRSLSC
jgi:hypothetical protein